MEQWWEMYISVMSGFKEFPNGMVAMNRKTPLTLYVLEDTARYVSLLLAPAEGFGRGFFSLRAKKESLLCCFGPLLAIFGAQ